MCWRHSACRKCVAAEWRVYVCGCGVWIEHQPSRVEMGKKASEMREKKRSTCTYWGHSFIRPYNRTSYSALRMCTSLNGLWVYLCSTSVTGGTAKMATYVVPSNLILYILRNAVRGFWIYSGQFTWAAEIQFSFFPVAFVSSFVVDAHCLTYTHTHRTHRHHPSVLSSDCRAEPFSCVHLILCHYSNFGRIVRRVCVRVSAFVIILTIT